MSSRQDATEKTCALCLRPIVQYEWMLDIFRKESSQGERRLEWCHADCARKLAENYVRKRESREQDPQGSK